jgi:hypothetical protein
MLIMLSTPYPSQAPPQSTMITSILPVPEWIALFGNTQMAGPPKLMSSERKGLWTIGVWVQNCTPDVTLGRGTHRL